MRSYSHLGIFDARGLSGNKLQKRFTKSNKLISRLSNKKKIQIFFYHSLLENASGIWEPAKGENESFRKKSINRLLTATGWIMAG
jgi:hypothetical protein